MISKTDEEAKLSAEYHDESSVEEEEEHKDDGEESDDDSESGSEPGILSELIQDIRGEEM